MKRFFAVLFACLLIVSSACAGTVADMSDYSAVLGGSDLKDGDARDPYIRFIQDDCVITLKLDNGEIVTAFIDGTGDKFLAYCAAALAIFDPDGRTETFGQFLTAYLLAHTQTGQQDGRTSNGIYFSVGMDEGVFTFGIVK